MTKTATKSGDRMRTRAKRVLVVAHDFPPYRTSGVYRVTGLTKYLSAMGWTVSVLAADTRGCEQEPDLLRRVPQEVEVIRSRAPSTVRWEAPAARALKKLGALKPQQQARGQRTGDTWLRRAGDLLRSVLYFPDEMVAWIPFAFMKGIRMHRRHRFATIYSSGPPRSSALVGLLLHLTLGIPWVLEFRDPWYFSERPLRRGFESMLHGFLLNRADAVVAVTEGHALDLKNTWGVPAEKLHVIRNGFDEDDFRNGQDDYLDALPKGYFHISHLGTIYEGHSGTFFSALRELAIERPDITNTLRVNIIGYPDRHVLHMANDPQLKPLIQLQGLISHEQSLKVMRASNGLLIFLADPRFSRMAISGKTYEYLRVGRPILAIAHEGGVQELIEEGKAGRVVHPEDTAGIKQALQALFDEHSGNGHRPQPAQPAYVSQFRYDRLAQRLSGIFEKVTGNAA